MIEILSAEDLVALKVRPAPHEVHDGARSAPYRGRVLRLVRSTGMKPGSAASEIGYERHVITFWRRCCPGFGEALATARADAIHLKLEELVAAAEAGATIGQALQQIDRSWWWFGLHIQKRPDLRRRLERVRPMHGDITQRVERLVELLDAGVNWTEACSHARTSRIGWPRLERTHPELYEAIIAARARNDIGKHSVGRKAWKTRRARVA